MAISSRNRTGRRTVLGLLLGAATLPFAALPAAAMDAAAARALVDRVVGEINGIINSGKSESAMYRDFEGIFDRYADVPTIARSALGPPARTATSAQLAAFGDAFGTYLARKYGARFREFIGSDIVIRDVRPIREFVEVRSTVDLRGRAPFAVSFMVSDRSGSNRFFDIVIEGISLLKTERVEIGAMLEARRGDIDRLIRDLRSA